MREIKFRVWYENVRRGHKKGEEIVWGTESYYDYEPVIDNGGLLEVEGGWDIFGNSEENYILEQYTGLKDKNGKEIYEGDIVEALIDGMWSTGRSTVGFGKAKWRLEVLYNDIRFMDVFRVIGSKNCPDRIYYLFDKELSDIEVIGNIHENPELVRGEE